MNTFDLFNAIHQNLDSLQMGSLTFWGDWFGRPYDNIHRIVGADARTSSIVIYFNCAECLRIEDPEGWSLDRGILKIRDARLVRFQWFLYGEMPGQDSLRFVEYRKANGQIAFETDFLPDVLRPDCKINGSAVELHTS